jgi:hypothetical protein
MKTPILFMLSSLIATQICFSQQSGNKDMIAEIKVEQTENILTLSANVQNLSPLYFSHNYLLLVKKTNSQNNLSINRQGGKFTLEPEEAKILSTIRLNQNDKTSIQAFLYIRDEEKNKLITKDSLFINTNKEQQQKRSQDQAKNQLLLDGMIIDESKTKFGKNFYDELFSKYNQFSKKFNFVITVSEYPYRGMTTAIEIKVNRETVYKFFSNPNEEYRKKQVSMTLRRLWKYQSRQ